MKRKVHHTCIAVTDLKALDWSWRKNHSTTTTYITKFYVGDRVTGQSCYWLLVLGILLGVRGKFPETSSGNLPRTPCTIPKTKNQYSFHGERLKSTPVFFHLTGRINGHEDKQRARCTKSRVKMRIKEKFFFYLHRILSSNHLETSF
jgi:hypothetical protein